MRRAIGIAVTALLVLAVSGCGTSDDQQLKNVAPMVSAAVLGFGIAQASPAEVESGTLMVQLNIWPKDELEGMAQGVCREIASYIKGEPNEAEYPNLVQIYGVNGDYWLQCQPRDIPVGQEQHYESPACRIAIDKIAKGESASLDVCTTGSR